MPSPVRWQQTGGGAKDEAVPVVALRMPPQGRHASGIHRLVMRPRYRVSGTRGLAAGLYQPLADGGAVLLVAPPDHAHFLQSGQKAKTKTLSPGPSSSPPRKEGTKPGIVG